ncbi:MAG: hypothetical protein J6R10_04630, partial [Tidjanibacter sp.]|nr:hypothetical protein [Tidjanibacter sp.]
LSFPKASAKVILIFYSASFFDKKFSFCVVLPLPNPRRVGCMVNSQSLGAPIRTPSAPLGLSSLLPDFGNSYAIGCEVGKLAKMVGWERNNLG